MTTLEEPPSGPEFVESILAPQSYLALHDCQPGRIYYDNDPENNRFGFFSITEQGVALFTTVHLRGITVVTQQEKHADIAGSFKPARVVEFDLDDLEVTDILVLLAACNLNAARQQLAALHDDSNSQQTADESLAYQEAAMRVNYFERLLGGLTEAD